MPVANPYRVDRGARDLAVLVFAKAPVPGHCKTRLARGCHPHRAAAIYRALLEHAVATVCAQAGSSAIALVCAPSTRHPFFKRLARRYGISLRRQARGDLGARMHAAIRATLGRHRAVVLMGSDQPELADDWLAAAANALVGGCAWLAPTTDGGYWAIGLNRPDARVFRGPRWGTTQVARRTRRNAARCGLDISYWPARADVDTWRDWRALPRVTRARIARRATLVQINRGACAPVSVPRPAPR